MSARVFDHLVNAYNGDDKRKQEIGLYQHAKDSLLKANEGGEQGRNRVSFVPW